MAPEEQEIAGIKEISGDSDEGSPSVVEKVMPQTEAHYCLGDGDGGGEEESCAKGGFGIAEE